MIAGKQGPYFCLTQLVNLIIFGTIVLVAHKKCAFLPNPPRNAPLWISSGNLGPFREGPGGRSLPERRARGLLPHHGPCQGVIAQVASLEPNGEASFLHDATSRSFAFGLCKSCHDVFSSGNRYLEYIYLSGPEICHVRRKRNLLQSETELITPHPPADFPRPKASALIGAVSGFIRICLG